MCIRCAKLVDVQLWGGYASPNLVWNKCCLNYKISRIFATSGILQASECTKFVLRRGSAPDPATGDHDATQIHSRMASGHPLPKLLHYDTSSRICVVYTVKKIPVQNSKSGGTPAASTLVIRSTSLKSRLQTPTHTTIGSSNLHFGVSNPHRNQTTKFGCSWCTTTYRVSKNHIYEFQTTTHGVSKTTFGWTKLLIAGFTHTNVNE